MRWIFLAFVAVFLAALTSTQFPNSQPLDKVLKADRVIIYKSQRKLVLLNRYQIIKTYRVSLGGNPQGPKNSEDDGRTPEGTYRIDWRNADSAYHLSLHLSYPNAQDRTQALQKGDSPGDDMMIHGIKNGLGLLGFVHHLWDWTDGGIAVTNGQIREIWQAVPDGTMVDIRA